LEEGLLSLQKPRSQEKRKRKGDENEEREGEGGSIFVSKQRTSLL
jgi:hypothetical protein